MSDLTTSHGTPQIEGEVEATLEQALSELQHLNALMQQHQKEIDRLKAESKIITDHTDALLTTIDAQLVALRRAS